MRTVTLDLLVRRYGTEDDFREFAAIERPVGDASRQQLVSSSRTNQAISPTRTLQPLMGASQWR
jgi:hypothetical protein